MKSKIYNNDIFDEIRVDVNGDVKSVKQIKELIINGNCPVDHTFALFGMLESSLNYIYRKY